MKPLPETQRPLLEHFLDLDGEFGVACLLEDAALGILWENLPEESKQLVRSEVKKRGKSIVTFLSKSYRQKV